jgi:hypothetical protein
MRKALGVLAMAAVLLSACTGGSPSPSGGSAAETERPASAPAHQGGISRGNDVEGIAVIQLDTPTVPCPAEYAPHTTCILNPSGHPVRAQVRGPLSCHQDTAGTLICDHGNGLVTHTPNDSGLRSETADPWAMPIMPPEVDRWVDPGICGPYGATRAVGFCSKRPRPDGNADLLDANGTVVGIVVPNQVPCGPGRDFIPGPCVSRPGPNGTVTFHDANGRQIGVAIS